jgi:hypothetical protein
MKSIAGGLVNRLTPIVKRAMLHTIIDVGQLTQQEHNELAAAVKLGYLVQGKGGPFPVLKTVYALPGFDFAAARREQVAQLFAEIAELEDSRNLQPTILLFDRESKFKIPEPSRESRAV